MKRSRSAVREDESSAQGIFMMNRTTTLLFAALGLAAAVGCYTGPNADLSSPTPGPGVSADGTEPTLDEDGEAPDGGAAAAEGLPCDVAKVLATSCTDCHGRKLSGGAPNRLVTYDDLVAPSEDDPNRTVAEVSLARMKAAKKPMPPDGKLDSADLAIFEGWVTAKMPKGSCGTKTATPDGGSVTTDGGATPDSGPKQDAAVASVCTSGTTWVKGTPASALMLPGKPCLACHAATGGPLLTLAGTVYPTLHEPNGCYGVPAGMTVVIVDAAGKSHSMPVGPSGNFTRVTGIPMPYRAMVVNGTKVREMKTPQTDGDCNGCHSEQGTGAPGRVMAP